MTAGLHKLNKEYGKGLSKLVKKVIVFHGLSYLSQEQRANEEGGSLGAAHRALLAQVSAEAEKAAKVC